MAFRLSDRDRAASQAAAAIRQANRAQADYDALMPQAQAKMAQAQQGPSNPLEAVLSGIGNTIATAGKGLGDFFTSGAINAYAGTGLKSLLEGKSYAQAAREANRDVDDFKKRYYDTDSLKDAYAKSAGTALDTASTLSDLIPGLGKGAKVALNVGQGVVSGFANPFIEKGSQATLEDAMRGAAVGGASAGVGQYVGGKLAGRTAGKGAISKALNSNIGKAALTGAASGAAGGGLNAALSGGDLGQTLGGAWQGAQGGALAGGTMAGTMGLIGTGIDKLNQRYGAEAPTDMPVARRAPVATNTEAEPTNVAPRNIETPTRRAIDVQYDGEAEPVNVSRRASNQYRLAKGSGSTLDGVLGPNNKTKLPNALPDTRSQFRRLFGDDTSDISAAVKNGLLDAAGDDAISGDAVLKDILDKNTYDQLRAATRDYADYSNSSLDGYGVSSKSQLPKIKTSDYIEATGYKGQDIPEYMRPFLSEENGRSLKDSSWSQIMPQYNNEGQFTGTPDDVLQMYDDLAGTNRNVTYTNDNLVGALETNPDLYVKATEQVLADSYPTRKIDVDKQLPLGQRVDVDTPDSRPLIRDIRPVTRQAQAQTAQEAPTQMPAQRVPQNGLSASDARTKAYDWGGDSLSGAGKKRNYLQVIGGNLQDTAQVTRDAAVYGKLKGNTADEMIRKGAVDNLRNNYGYSPDDYKQAAAVSTAVNKWYDNEIKTSGATANIQDLGKRLRGVGRNDYILPEKYEKVFAEEIGSALSQANVHDSKSMTVYSADGLEKAAKYLEQKEQKLRRTSHGGDKAAQGTIDPNDGKLADRYREARLILRGEINNMIDLDDITRGNLSKVLDDLGATDAAKQQILSANGFAGVKAATSPLEDARTMYNQMRSSGMKRGANADNSTSVGTQIVSKTGLSGVIDALGKPIRDSAAAAEKLAGRAISAAGDVVSGKNVSGKVGKVAGKAADMLNNDTFSGREISPITRQGQTQTIGDVAMRQLSRQAGLGAGRYQDTQNAIQNAAQEAQDIQSNYENSMMQAQQAYAQAQQAPTAQGSETLDRVSRAMDLALAAGDLDAYSQLADLYKQAYGIYQLQNPTANSAQGQSDAKALTANQTKALTGLQQLQSLSGMQPGLGTALASSPLGGVVNMFGGDDYANQAQSLALTLGYLQSGANITPREAENIGRAYIPTAYDSEGVRQNKLSRAEQLLRNYLADTSSLPQ